MLYFGNRHTHEQFYRIHQKAIESQKEIKTLQLKTARLLSSYTDKTNKSLSSNYQQLQDEISEHLWCHNWLDNVNRWLTTLGIVTLYAMHGESDDGEVTEFGLAVYERPFDSLGAPTMDVDILRSQCGRKAPFSYSCVLKNYNTASRPNWAVLR